MQVTRVRISATSKGFKLFADYRLRTGKRMRKYVGFYKTRQELNRAIEALAAADMRSVELAGTGGV